MSNILNHNRILIDFIMTGEDYWDFHLSDEMGYLGTNNMLSTDCLSAYIDFNDPECIFWDSSYSKNSYIWKEAINDGEILDYIGVTGVDNGLITYEKDKITNREFLEIYLNSKYDTNKGDMRLRLNKINGNNQIYDYSASITHIDNIDAVALNGGFYQGFFKIYERNYQTLPSVLENGWSLEVRLKKSDFENKNVTINDVHPENKGIFLYLGTRAENKWWNKYSVETKFDPSPTNYSSDDYFEDGYIGNGNSINDSYVIREEEDINPQKKCKKNTENGCNHYVEDDYFEKDEEITGNEQLLTSDGFDFSQPNIIQYDTDNKFILFNRTPDGFTTKTWEDGTVVTMYDIKRPDIGNYFLLFNRTKDGYTTKTIDELIEEENKKYNVLNDIYRNALAFQIKDNGSIGFKYIVKDCESEEENYKIEELFSKEGIIADEEWYTISIKIVPTIDKFINSKICNNSNRSSSEKMIIYIYVNGKLKLKSQELPILNLKALNDLADKQQGVPFTLSLGGGTQGLCDTVNINYLQTPKNILPLEKEFCGSFIGYIHFFRFYDCPLNFTEIYENYEYDMNK